jgi:hypothetical protein
MSSTIVGVLVGAAATLCGVWLSNRRADRRAEVDRDEAEARAKKDRDAAEARANQDRAAAEQRASDDRRIAEERAAHDRREAEERAARDRAALEALHRADREADHQRERLHELRLIVDDAVRAMYDMWTVLGIFVITSLRMGPAPHAHLMEDREPSVQEFVEVYGRLRDAHVRLLARVPWDDTLHAPVGSAITAAQAAWNAVVNEGFPRSEEADRLIAYANQQASIGFQELQDTARARFAPGGLEGSLRAVVLVLHVRGNKEQSELYLAPLRLARHAKVMGPDANGRVIVRDQESESGAARASLESDLDAIGAGWRQVLELDPPPAVSA